MFDIAALCRQVGAAGFGTIAAGLLLPAAAYAGDVTPLTAVSMTQAIAGTQSDGASVHVFRAPAVGTVTASRAADIVGPRIYARRHQEADLTTVVGFSATPPPVSALPDALMQISAQAPLYRAALTSGFGAPRAALGGGIRAHAGIDLAAPIGSAVAATIDGRVTSARWAQGYGLLVTLDHGNGLETRYAHLSSIAVAPGQIVRRGQVLGLVGSTGHSTGPHLHYEMRENGRPINPLAR